MEQLKISIIIPVYNVEPYIKRCIDSIQNQSYRNIEIILINDGSKDRSGLICDELAKKDSKIRVYHKENGGVSSARNLGLKYATGDLIGFVDPDDWIEHNMYEILARDILENNAQAAFCFHYEAFDDGRLVSWSVSDKTLVVDKEEAMYKAMAWPHQGGGYFTSIWNKLFCREVIYEDKEKAILFDTDLKIGEDETWLIRVLCNCKKIVLDHHSLYYWFQRAGSATYVDGLTQNRLDEIKAKVTVLSIIQSHNLSKRLVDLASTNIFDTVYNLHVKCYLKDREFRRYFYKLLMNNWAGWNRTHRVSILGNFRKIISLILMQFGIKPV